MDYRKRELKMLQDSFWRERVFGVRELADEKIAQRMECLQLQLDGPQYCVILFAPYLMEKEADQIDRILAGLLSSVRDEYRRNGIHCYTTSDSYCNIVAILSLDSDSVYRKLNRLTIKMTNELIQRYSVDMFVGIGEPVDRLSELNISKDTASDALAYKFTFSEEHVISAKDVKHFYNRSDVELRKHYDMVMGCFYDGNMELMAVRLHNLFSAVAEASANKLDSIRNVCIELTATLLRVVQDMGVARSPEMDSVYTYIAQIDSIPEISDWFLSYCSRLLRSVSDIRNDKTQQILDIVDRYIENNLSDPNLSVQTISDYVELSSPYFSNIFFKAKGMHINEYVNRIRIKYAQRMLTEANSKVVTIATSLGFSSPSYFNSVFKRYTGVTPSQYRSSYRK